MTIVHRKTPNMCGQRLQVPEDEKRKACRWNKKQANQKSLREVDDTMIRGHFSWTLLCTGAWRVAEKMRPLIAHKIFLFARLATSRHPEMRFIRLIQSWESFSEFVNFAICFMKGFLLFYQTFWRVPYKMPQRPILANLAHFSGCSLREGVLDAVPGRGSWWWPRLAATNLGLARPLIFHCIKPQKAQKISGQISEKSSCP